MLLTVQTQTACNKCPIVYTQSCSKHSSDAPGPNLLDPCDSRSPHDLWPPFFTSPLGGSCCWWLLHLQLDFVLVNLVVDLEDGLQTCREAQPRHALVERNWDFAGHDAPRSQLRMRPFLLRRLLGSPHQILWVLDVQVVPAAECSHQRLRLGDDGSSEDGRSLQRGHQLLALRGALSCPIFTRTKVDPVASQIIVDPSTGPRGEGQSSCPSPCQASSFDAIALPVDPLLTLSW